MLYYQQMRAKLKRIADFCLLVFAGTLVYLVWNESVAWYRWIQGVVISTLAFGITNRFLLRHPYQQIFAISPIRLVHYLVVLFVAIFRSGFHAIWITLQGRIDVGVVDIPTALENPFHVALVASAITLTPGTVTVDFRPGLFKVVWIEKTATNPEEAGQQIKDEFERIFIDQGELEEL